MPRMGFELTSGGRGLEEVLNEGGTERALEDIKSNVFNSFGTCTSSDSDARLC